MLLILCLFASSRCHRDLPHPHQQPKFRGRNSVIETMEAASSSVSRAVLAAGSGPYFGGPNRKEDGPASSGTLHPAGLLLPRLLHLVKAGGVWGLGNGGLGSPP